MTRTEEKEMREGQRESVLSLSLRAIVGERADLELKWPRH